MSGYSFGVSAAVFGMQLQELRRNKGVSHEDIAEATELDVSLIQGLEQAKMSVFVNASTESLTALARYFDVAVRVVFSSSVSVPESIAVTPFEQDLSALSTHSKPAVKMDTDMKETAVLSA